MFSACDGTLLEQCVALYAPPSLGKYHCLLPVDVWGAVLFILVVTSPDTVVEAVQDCVPDSTQLHMSE